MDFKNSVLWYPETVEELLFLKEKFPIASGEVYHLGVKNFPCTFYYQSNEEQVKN